VSRDRQAFIEWSAIVEPADEVAGALISAWGAAEALEWARHAADKPEQAARELHASMPAKNAAVALRSVATWAERLRSSDAAAHLGRASLVGARAVTRIDPDWPATLNDLGPVAPMCLWVRGSADVAAAWEHGIAVVGSRASTNYGEHVAASIASHLADAGVPVISGGAFGIDARAHRAALAADAVTIAVMAGGIDRYYPLANADILERIQLRGAVISELPPGFAPHRSRFLTRNRVIAAARATVVVEAARRSGALSTANHAADLARPLGAVPGPVTSASSGGCHALIREGKAVCVTSGEDVLELAGPLTVAPATLEGVGGIDFGDARARRAYDAIAVRGSTVEQIVQTSRMDAADTRVALGALELLDLIQSDGVKWRRRRP